ncbi:YfhO family protein [uncultured Draconibacterium sp.]|uniref:YfhO family protein n=1 Tax=uncultured Draconibacterium sp. TaxID=1573823 RepID=UPI0029C71865|nr:YfhO family protein [uncultured Draconibacterium sp.]
MKINRFIKKWGTLILLAICIVAFWQVAFLQNALKWDFVDAYLPARYFFSEAVLNNIFPFWNPYILYGVPFYADLVSVFNPEFWIVANMFGYNNITLQLVFLAYVFLAGINFRYFLQRFKVTEPVALSLAIAYMLSGFTVGNAQHLSFVAAYALLPLVVATYLQMLWQLKTKNLVRFSLVFLMLVFAAYPGLTVIITYLLLVVFIYYLATFIKRKVPVRRFLIYHSIVAVIVFAGSAVLLLAYFQAQPFFSRYSGLNLDQALMNPFTLRSFISFVFPMSTGADVAYFGTDISMSNAYFGLFGLLLFLIAITGKIKEKVSLLFLLVAAFSLLAALGNHFFLREFMFDYFPFMNMFKYPSIFRAVGIFGFLAFAGLNCEFKSLASEHRKRLWASSSVLIVFILVVAIRAFNNIDTFHFPDFSQSWAEQIQHITMSETLVLQALVHIFLLATFIAVVLLKNSRKYLPLIFVLLFAVDGIVSTQLNLHYTVVSSDDPTAFKSALDAKPKGFPIPDLHPVGENSDKNAADKFTWLNNNVFPKRPTFDGLVSFKTDGYYTLSRDYPQLMDAMKRQPLFFLSDDVRSKSDTANCSEKTVFIAPENIRNFEDIKINASPNDNLKITSFSPNNIILETNTTTNQLLVFQQNNFAGWQVWVDGEQREIVTANSALMAVLVPGGAHVVQFKYRNNLVLVFFVVSMMLALALAIVLLMFHVKEDSKSRRKMLWSVFGFVLLFLVLTVNNRLRYQKNQKGLLPKIEQEFDALKGNKSSDVTTFLSYASSTDVDVANADYQFYLDEDLTIADFGKILAQVETHKFALGWVNGAVSAENMEMLFSYFPLIEMEKQTKNSGLILARTGENSAYQFTEDFELRTKSAWQIDEKRIESDSIANNRYYTFSPDEKWGASLQITIDEENSNLKKLALLGDLRFPETLCDINVVISVSRGKEEMEYYTRKMIDFAAEVGSWSRFAVVKKFDKELFAGDVIHIYFWNRTQARFDVDGLKVKLN